MSLATPINTKHQPAEKMNSDEYRDTLKGTGHMNTIEMDELGRFWVFDAKGAPFSGPYDTPEDAQRAYPDAELVLE